MQAILVNGYGSLEKATFKFVKFKHMRHLFNDFHTKTMLAAMMGI